MSNLNIFKQPNAFYLIFSIEFWERFGFYGMQATLTVYMVKIMGMDESASFVLFGAFSALVYGFVAIGGWIGDKVIGTKRAITLGAIVMMVGYVLVGLSTAVHPLVGPTLIYIAMGFITVGNGLFKANPSSLLAKLYPENDPRLDGAFTMYYMAINLGSFFSMIITPANKMGYGMAFGMSKVRLAITVVNFLFCLRMLKGTGSPADLMPLNKMYLVLVAVGSIIASLVCSYYKTSPYYTVFWLLRVCLFWDVILKKRSLCLGLNALKCSLPSSGCCKASSLRNLFPNANFTEFLCYQ